MTDDSEWMEINTSETHTFSDRTLEMGAVRPSGPQFIAYASVKNVSAEIA